MQTVVSKEDRLRIIQLDFEISKMWALKWQTEIVSEAYKTRKMFKLSAPTALGEPSKQVPLTDEEKLQDAMATMQAHIHNMSDFADGFKSLIHEENIS